MELVDIFREVVQKVEGQVLEKLKVVDANIETVHYEHGHYTEIHETLRQFEESPAHYNKKYPLIALIEDIPAKVDNGIKEYRYSVIICYSSRNDAKSKDRYAEVINPILNPIYEALIRNMLDSGYFMGYDIPHEKIIRPYMGSPGKMGNNANIFSDFLDAIELRNVRCKMNPPSCDFEIIM